MLVGDQHTVGHLLEDRGEAGALGVQSRKPKVEGCNERRDCAGEVFKSPDFREGFLAVPANGFGELIYIAAQFVIPLRIPRGDDGY
jgi:hypothetical protein